MTDHKLSEREELILRAIVHQYITSAEPVGSRVIVKRYKLDISPATVRNVMADLEDSGFIQQLHTSSGRVPTDQGYRYYVEFLMRVQEVTLAERQRLEHELNQRLSDADEVMHQTSRILAFMSHHTGIVQAPRASDAVVRAIEVIPVSTDRVAVLIVDNYGRVRTLVIPVSRGLASDELLRLNPFLNDTLRGAPIASLSTSLESRMRSLVDEQRALAERAIVLLSGLSVPTDHGLFLEGASHLMDHPEFRDVEKAREVFGLLEERGQILELLREGMLEAPRAGSRIVIGHDGTKLGLDNISVVAAPYMIDEQPVGYVGILGPRRMQYSKLAGLVEYTASTLSRLLTRLAH